MDYWYIHFRIRATGRAKRIDSYLMGEKKGGDMNESGEKRTHNRASYRDSRPKSERQKRKEWKRKGRNSSTISHPKQYRC